MLIKSALVTQISGSIGGMTGSHNRGGLYFRARTIPVNPNTPQQARVRAAMAALVVRWQAVLTQIQRDAWGVYATNVPLTGPLGDPITVSGINMYIRSNVLRTQVFLSVQDEAPTVFNLGQVNEVALDNATQAGQTVDITFTDTDLWNLDGGGLSIQLSRPQNLTINFFRGPYRNAGFIIGDTAIPLPSPQAIGVPFPFVINQRLFGRVVATFPDGRLSVVQFLQIDTQA